MTASELLDMPVCEVLAAIPAAARVFLDHGMRCPGCPFAPFETLAEAAAIYGVDAVTLAADVIEASGTTLPGGLQ